MVAWKLRWQIYLETYRCHGKQFVVVDKLVSMHTSERLLRHIRPKARFHGNWIMTSQKFMASMGIEPTTFALLARRSNQLS